MVGEHELLMLLCEKPLTPHKAAEMIVKCCASDLSPEKQQVLRQAIQQWGDAWGEMKSYSAQPSIPY